MPPSRPLPEWIKAAATATLSCMGAIAVLALSEGARRERADNDHRLLLDHDARIQSIEREGAADREWKRNIKETLDGLRLDAKEIKADLRAISK